MDLYVPAPALQPNPTLLPVVVWFYGGAYIFGAKDAGASSDLPLYDPTGMMQLLPGKFIFVASNYRMGAFGWLAGPTMEANAVPNVGLEDQRLALQFVRDRISLFGGDATKVSAWGQSAGAGSILHHLIAQDPDKGVPRDPLFTRAILQSPAFEPQWDQSTTGMAAIAFNNLTVLAGCTQGSGSDQIQCLQGKDQDSLVTWNQAIIDQVKCSGILPFGPAIDGKVIKHLPAVAFQNSTLMVACQVDSII